jgi:catalase
VRGLAHSQGPEQRSGGDDFAQAGVLYRLMSDAQKQRLVDRIAGSLALVSRDDIIERSISCLRKGDPDCGERLAAAVRARRATSSVRGTPGCDGTEQALE